MNRQIGTLFRMAAIGVALLITITAYWQIWAASSLAPGATTPASSTASCRSSGG